MITDYTTYDRLRSVLGLGPKELTDLQLDNSTHLEVLFLDRLSVLSENLETNYQALVALDPLTLTNAQTRFVSLMKVYATYYFGYLIADNLSALLQKVITDGRAKVERFDYVAIQQASLIRQLTGLEGRLKQLYLVLYPAEVFSLSEPAAVTVAAAVGLAIDPITGV